MLPTIVTQNADSVQHRKRIAETVNQILRGYNPLIQAITVSAQGNVTINAPSSDTGLTVNGLSGANTQILSSTGAASSFSSGWNVGIGAAWSLYTSSTDPIIFGTTGAAALSLITNNTARITIGTTGGIQVGSPTGGDKGAGTLNTAGAIYQNNSRVPISAFTTVNGVTGAVSGGQGISFSSKPFTGIYVLTLSGFSSTPFVVAAARTSLVVVRANATSSTSVTVTITDTGGSGVDANFDIIAVGT